MIKVELKEQIKNLPVSSGIYIFKSSKNKPLYVGKALNLKNRTSNYLKTNDTRLQRMLSEAEKIDFTETDSGIEALILESQYIKKYKPSFNITFRDDKQYGFIGFTKEKYPKIFITHQPKKDVSSSKYHVLRSKNKLKTHNTKYIIHNTNSYIGPFTDIGALKTTLRLLRKIFPYCTCRQLHNNYCLNYHIGKCPGDCCLKKPVPSIMYYVLREYQRNIKAIKNILNGNRNSLVKQFEKEMKHLSIKRDYEKALELQYKIKKLRRIFENARIIHNTNSIIHNTEIDKHSTDTLKHLANLIGIDRPPRRIEAYDIANIQGHHATGAMVVFENGQPNKNEYRKFKIYTKNTADDTGMLREILTRRFKHPEWQYPDLVIVDGGKAQLNTARSVIKNIPIIALTKNEKHIGHKILYEDQEVVLSKLPEPVKNLLLHINSEAHRFAISYYRRLHRKTLN